MCKVNCDDLQQRYETYYWEQKDRITGAHLGGWFRRPVKLEKTGNSDAARGQTFRLQRYMIRFGSDHRLGRIRSIERSISSSRDEAASPLENVIMVRIKGIEPRRFTTTVECVVVCVYICLHRRLLWCFWPILSPYKAFPQISDGSRDR